jgi:cellobiose-specific phosphotransferase system component IIA
LEALNKLGFSDFTRDALNVLNDCKLAAAKRRRQSTRLENLGISEEELFRQQQELIQQARQKMNEEFQQQNSLLQTQTIENNKENQEENSDDDY